MKNTVKYSEIGNFKVGIDPELTMAVCRADLPEHRSDGFIILLNGELLTQSLKPSEVAFINQHGNNLERSVSFHGYAFPIDSDQEPEIKRLFNVANLSLV